MMSYSIEFSNEFERSIKKLKKRNKLLFNQIQKKLIELVKNPEHYKPLKNVLAGFRRIKFGSFVLIYKVSDDTVRIISLDHHDDSY